MVSLPHSRDLDDATLRPREIFAHASWLDPSARPPRYIGTSSTLDPLFKADKLMIQAIPLVSDELQDEYSNAVDAYIAKQQMSSTMAYTSSWSGIENPNGSVQQIEANLEEAKKEVIETRAALRTVIQCLGLPPAPAFTE